MLTSQKKKKSLTPRYPPPHTHLAPQPCCVILYEPDLTFIRQIEVFHAERSNRLPLLVHHLTYGGSLEAQSHLEAVQG
ncbi:hypothetical protein FOA52_006509 [Chlamydomonas sp. UWO 241]|nr:hypothetical protein FOA52_006509 [Chlamydomonas sp. UWO 241]